MRVINRLLIVFACALQVACAGWQNPPPIDPQALRAQSVETESQGVLARARVLSPVEQLQVVGADLSKQKIQVVWLEIDNGSGQSLSLLQSGADPEYFSPLEVSWSLHGWLGRAKNRAIDQHLQSLAFRRGPIRPGETRSGLLFTNPHLNQKLLNIDLLGEQRFIAVNLMLPVPGDSNAVREDSGWVYEPGEMIDYQHERELSAALTNWYASLPDDTSIRLTQPLTLVWVGRPRDIGSMLVRRGYRLQPLDFDLEERLQGRAPDYVLRKSGRGAPANWIRLWALPISFQGRPVLVGQAGAPAGGRFAHGQRKAQTDLAMAEVRDLVIQDLLYSGGLIKMAIAHPPPLVNETVVADQRVGVLFVARRPSKIADIRIVNWAKVDWSTEPDPYAP